ncbi:MAG TPA: hypothetical protein VGB22_09590 [candidate division Zixibacteria bacterium]|jgi:hypothetical protein
MTAILGWAAVLLSIAVYRVWFPGSPMPAALTLNYDLLVIALIGLHRGMRAGAIGGWVIGFVASATDPATLGFGTLFGALLGWVIGYWGERMFIENAISRWLLLWLALLVERLLFLALAASGDWSLWFSSIWTGALASAGLTATVGAAISLLWERSHLRSGSRARRSSSGDVGGTVD